MTVEKARGYIREALEAMGYRVKYEYGFWWIIPDNGNRAAEHLASALDSLDPMGTTYKEEG